MILEGVYGFARDQQKLSTSFYTWTNRQTERINQTIKTYIRCYMNYK
jgi:hypothetical protein